MNKRKKSGFWVLVVIGLFIYFAYTVIGQQKLLYDKNVEMNDVNANIAKEKKLNEELKKQKDMVNSDEYIEKIAREKLDMVKRGERVFVDVNK